MATIKCFFLEPTEKVARYLRRYESIDYANQQKGSCNDKGAPHDAMIRIEDAPMEIEPDGSTRYASGDDLWPRDDPRWPTVCEKCEKPFVDNDHWQLFCNRIYRRTDTGEEMILHHAPPGAMWYADWFGHANYRRNDPLHSLCIKTPAGEWLIDGPASNGPGWTRTGEPPNITATPSIGQGDPMRYHGWLRNGELIDV